MKMLSLDLIAYGNFTDRVIDLSEGKEGLHIIYGPNEAGKSVALRALEALFFGIPSRTEDSFLHDKKNLRIGALLRHSDNSELAFTRRKGQKNTIMDIDGNALDDSILEKYLSGIKREIYSTMFGLDHRKLVEGGREIVMGGGALGESLFAAGMGVTGLREVLDGLQNEAEGLFKPRASTPVINTLSADFKEMKKQEKDFMLSTREWQEHDKALNDASSDRQKVDEEISRLISEERRLQRLHDALPKIAERNDLLSKLDEMKDIVLLDPDFPEQRRNAVRKLEDARSAEKKTDEYLYRIREDIEKLSVPESLIQQESVITKLHMRLGSHLKARDDLPKRQGQFEELQASARTMLLELRPGLSLENAENLRLTEIKRVGILDLGAQHQALLDQQTRTIEALNEIEMDISEAKETLDKIDAPRDQGDLRFALQRARKQGDLEDRLKTARDRLENEEEQLDIDIKAQSLWSGTIEDIEALPVPSSETIDLYMARFDELNSQVRNLDDRINDKEGEVANLDNQIKALQIAGSVPTELELIEARRRRDQGWSLVRRTWINNEDVQEESNLFDPDASLHEAYEKSINYADEVADRLRREAERVAQLASFLADSEQFTKKLEEFKEDRDKILSQRTELENEWRDLWVQINIELKTPREMSAWLKKQEQLVSKVRSIRECRSQVESIEGLMRKHFAELHECLDRNGEELPATEKSINSFLDRCQALIGKIDNIAKQHENLENNIKKLKKKLPDAKRKREKAQSKLDEWKISWLKTVTEIGLPNDTTPSQANAFIAKIQDFLEKIDKAEGLSVRIEGMKNDANLFEEDVKSLLKQVAPELLEIPAHQATGELHSRLNKAREDAATLRQLETQRIEKKEVLQQARNSMNQLTDKLDNMCNKAGCSNYDEIEKAEQRSETKRSLQTRIDQIDKDLQEMAHSGGMKMDELIEKSEEVDPDSLPVHIENVQKNIETLKNESDKHLVKITTHTNELEKMDGNAKAAEVAQEKQAILAKIGEKSEDYLCLRIASAILNQEVERYREANQGPILNRASKLFSELTLGSFSGLKTSYNEGDKPILVGVRPSGEEITVDGMSDGSSDQLYLSLRLASLEKHLDENEPMPFILDDLLIQFDDDRAVTTLRALADLSKKTQIIFFTHHTHVLELAKKAVLDEVLQIHHLPIQ